MLQFFVKLNCKLWLNREIRFIVVSWVIGSNSDYRTVIKFIIKKTHWKYIDMNWSRISFSWYLIFCVLFMSHCTVITLFDFHFKRFRTTASLCDQINQHTKWNSKKKYIVKKCALIVQNLLDISFFSFEGMDTMGLLKIEKIPSTIRRNTQCR